MTVTIIVSTLNSEKSIQTCLNSILSQTYKNIELLIIDGKSSDNTVKLSKEITNSFHRARIISEPDLGIYDALNKGLKLAKGDIIGFVHSDDLLFSENVISEIIKEFKTKNIDGVYGDLQYVSRNNINSVIRNWTSCSFNEKLLKNGWMPPHPSLFLKRDVYEKHGNFDINFLVSADYDFILRIFADKDLCFKYIPKVITKMRVGGASNKNLANIILKSKEDLRAIKKNNAGNFLTLIKKNLSKIRQFI